MVMITQHVTVVGNVTNEGIIIHSFLFQSLDDFTYLFVHKSHIGVIISA